MPPAASVFATISPCIRAGIENAHGREGGCKPCMRACMHARLFELEGAGKASSTTGARVHAHARWPVRTLDVHTRRMTWLASPLHQRGETTS